MHAVRLVGMASLVLIVAGTLTPSNAADEPKDLIVGKWQPANANKLEATLEFKKDGTVRVEAKGLAVDGKYKFTKDNEVEMLMIFMNETMKETMTVKVTMDELTMKDSKGKEETFKKVK